jgi:hypothetical protein
MLYSNYARKLGGVIFFLLVAICVLSYYLYFNGPRVRNVTYDRSPEERAFHKGSVITINFDRPLNYADYSNQIRFTPEVEFKTQTSTQSILVIVEENLRHQSEYVLEIGPDIYDQTLKPMKFAHKAKLFTYTPRYVYLQRNYQQGINDRIIMRSMAGEERELFSSAEINQFAANNNYLLVSTKGAIEDSLYAINLESGEQRQVELRWGGRFDNLSIVPNSNHALFTVLTNRNEVSQAFFERFANRVESLDLESLQSDTLSATGIGYIQAKYIDLYSDGRVALLQDLDNQFLAVSPYNDYQPVVVGTHTTALGFDEDGNNIIFRDNTQFVQYQIESGDIKPISIPFDGYLQSFSQQNDDLYTLHVETGFEEIRTAINKLETWDDTEPSEIWSNRDLPGYHARKFKVNFDSELLSVELNTNNCQFDNYTPNIKCKEAKTALIDARNGEIIEEFRGVDLVWLP